MEQMIGFRFYHYNHDKSIEYIRTKECFITDVLPNIVLVAERETALYTAYSGEVILEKREDPDTKKLLRLLIDYSIRNIEKRGSSIFLASLELQKPTTTIDTNTQQQYIKKILEFFAAFRDALATTLSGARTRPLTIDELIKNSTGVLKSGM